MFAIWVFVIAIVTIPCTTNQIFCCIFSFCCYTSSVFNFKWPITLPGLNEGLSLNKHPNLFKHPIKRRRRVFVVNFRRNFEIFVKKSISIAYVLVAIFTIYCILFMYQFFFVLEFLYFRRAMEWLLFSLMLTEFFLTKS